MVGPWRLRRIRWVAPLAAGLSGSAARPCGSVAGLYGAAAGNGADPLWSGAAEPADLRTCAALGAVSQGKAADR